jgi:hypothetical protein
MFHPETTANASSVMTETEAASIPSSSVLHFCTIGTSMIIPPDIDRGKEKSSSEAIGYGTQEEWLVS